MDLIPQGHTTLTALYDRYRMWLWHGSDPARDVDLSTRLATLPEERKALHRAGLSTLTNAILQDLVGHFSVGYLEALVRLPGVSKNFTLPEGEWRKAFFPERLFLGDTVINGQGEYFESMVGRTPFVQIAALEAFLAESDTKGRHRRFASFQAAHDLLVGLVMDGVMKSAEAEGLTVKWGLPKLAERPSSSRFNPMLEVVWTLPMTIAWIVWRNSDDVREAWNAYRTECWEWVGIARRLPLDGGKEWWDVRGEELQTRKPIPILFVRGLSARARQDMVFDAQHRAFAFFKGTCTRGIYDNI